MILFPGLFLVIGAAAGIRGEDSAAAPAAPAQDLRKEEQELAKKRQQLYRKLAKIRNEVIQSEQLKELRDAELKTRNEYYKKGNADPKVKEAQETHEKA